MVRNRGLNPERTTAEPPPVPCAPHPAAPAPACRDLVSICVTSWKRPAELQQCVNSVAQHLPGYRVDVEDTGGNISRARNTLARRCPTPYFLLLEEDMEATPGTDLAPLVDVLESDSEIGAVSGRIRDIAFDWRHNFRAFRGRLIQEPSYETRVTKAGTPYLVCDLIHNFALFRTAAVTAVRWWERLEIGEHREFFYRFHSRWRSAHCRHSEVIHHTARPNDEYNRDRGRAVGFMRLAESSLCLRFQHPRRPDDLDRKSTLGERRNIAKRVLSDALAALRSLGIGPFASDGTALGMHRGGRFIAHDTDIDLGIWSEHERTPVVDVMRAAGFELAAHYGGPQDGQQWAFSRDGLKLDVFVYYRDDAPFSHAGLPSVWHAVWLRGQQLRYIYRPFGVELREIEGVQINAPPLSAIVDQYGPDWRTPDPSWDWSASPHNLKKT